MKWASIAVEMLVMLCACAGSTSVSSRASPSPPVVADFGPPPAGVPLVYLADPRHSGWYVGVDWSGKPRATMRLAQPLVLPQTLVQAPDGSGFMVLPIKGAGGAFLDRLGNHVVDVAYTVQSMMWADDSRQFCMLDMNPGPSGGWQISLQAPGAQPTAHPVALDPDIVRSGIIAIDFASCSAKNDRAVLVYNYFDRPTELYVVRISDGAVLLHQTHPANVLAGITASGDGALVAEDSGKSIGYIAGPTAPNTVVRRVADNTILAQLDPSYYVVAFSRDDSLALVSTTPLASGAPTNLALVRLPDGAVLWHRSSTEDWGGRWVRPDGNDIAFQLGPPQGPESAPIELVIVHPDGTATSLRVP